MHEEVKTMFEESIECKRRFMESADVGKIVSAAAKILECFKAGNKLMIFGNGGSAADAQHMAAELVGKYEIERPALPAIALTTDSSVLTAWPNDYQFESVFERQVLALAKAGDVLLGISTSGNSKNVLLGLESGKKIGTYNIALTGKDGGKIKSAADLNINVPYDKTARIQECHMVIYHSICSLIDREIKKRGIK